MREPSALSDAACANSTHVGSVALLLSPKTLTTACVLLTRVCSFGIVHLKVPMFTSYPSCVSATSLDPASSGRSVQPRIGLAQRAVIL